MQDVSKEWLDFRRNQFPAGSRIQTWELDDPRNTLKEARKLDYIDDSGRFHVRQSDGGECVLTLGLGRRCSPSTRLSPPSSSCTCPSPPASMPGMSGEIGMRRVRNGTAERFWIMRTGS